MKMKQDEMDLLESVDSEEWISVTDAEQEKGQLQSYAQAAFRKDRRMNIRILERDLV